MRKKSHIEQAGFLVQGMDNEVLNHRWKSFYFGNVLPDCKWSFVTMRHEYDGTFEMTAALLKSLAEESGYWSMDTASFVTDLGQVFHFLADYFTYPHNAHYPGNIKDHCTYENQLKHGLRAYIRSGRAVFAGGCHRRLNSVDDILDYIREMHDEYMRQPGSVENDCKYITTVCSNVLVSLPQFAGVAAMAYAG